MFYIPIILAIGYSASFFSQLIWAESIKWDQIYKTSSIDCSQGKKAECLQSYAREWEAQLFGRARTYELIYKSSTGKDLIDPNSSLTTK